MALVGRPRFSECLSHWTGLSLVSGPVGSSGHAPHPRLVHSPVSSGERAQDLLSSVAPGPGQGPALAAGPYSGPVVLPRAQSPTRLTSGRQCPAPLLRSLARRPRARGPEHRTRLQQPQAPVTARLPVPRGHLKSRRLRSSHASGPDLHQGTFQGWISSDFSASGPAALQDPQGVS
ncbi:hypothetical protein NDU88_000025 [Pleurodeles waltl]|uniref:Uncharacterized protein n=1 Tax=Pleurodeles waltl TaxID=8319 RepID=A0AAV7TDX6_PLEWA|nr:hypothetical protein NDU88_000025 [Pleurodeles waltl]